MPIKFLYSLFCLLTGVLSAMSSRAAGPGVINLLPSDYRAANKNWAVAEDDAGTLYAGNDKGLLEFDGLQWRLYELPRASIVRSVAPLSHDVIFTGGFEEFGRWDRDASGALRYTSLVPAQRNPRFSDSDFWKIYITPQGVLFQSFHGIYLYDYERVRRLTGEMNMLFLLRAGDEFWVQEMGGPLYRMRQESFERLPDSERFSTTTVRVLLPGPHEGEWIVGTGTDGLWRYDGERFTPWSPALSERLRRDELNCGIRTSRGTYLFGTLFGGLYEAGADGRLLAVLSTENRLLNNSVMALAEDAQQNVWAALDRGLSLLLFCEGVDYHTYNKWAAGSLYDACRWQGKLLLATNQGVFAVDESRLATGVDPSDFRPVAGLSGQAWSFDLLDGRLYVSHNTGVTELRPDFSLVRRSDMGGYGLRRVKLGEKSRTYYASYYKLRLLDDDGTMHEVDGLDESVYRIEADYMRNLWLEHPSKGVYRCRMSDDGRRIEERTLYGGGAGDGLPYKLHLLRVGGRVALMGDDRFFRYNEYTDCIEADTVLDAAFRTVEDIRRVIPYADERFWVITGSGVWKLRYDGRRSAELTPCAGIPVDNMIYGYEQVARLDDSTCLFCGDNGFELVSSQAVEIPPLRFLRYSNRCVRRGAGAMRMVRSLGCGRDSSPAQLGDFPLRSASGRGSRPAFPPPPDGHGERMVGVRPDGNGRLRPFAAGALHLRGRRGRRVRPLVGTRPFPVRRSHALVRYRLGLCGLHAAAGLHFLLSVAVGDAFLSPALPAASALAGDRRVAARQPGADPADRDARRRDRGAEFDAHRAQRDHPAPARHGQRVPAEAGQPHDGASVAESQCLCKQQTRYGERLDAVPDQVRAEALFLFPHHEGTLPRPDDQRSASERLPENESLYQGDRLADESVGAGGRERPLPAAKETRIDFGPEFERIPLAYRFAGVGAGG